MLFVARIVRLGFLADFLSRTVLIGFLTGVGIQVAIGQVGGMLGIDAASTFTIAGHEFSGTFAKLASTLGAIDELSWTTFAVAAGRARSRSSAMKRIAPRSPGALIAVVGAIAISWIWDLAVARRRHGRPAAERSADVRSPRRRVVRRRPAARDGRIDLHPDPRPERGDVAFLREPYNERFDENVDLVGLGAANVAAAFSGAFVVNGSPTKTQMVDDAGGKSQLAQLTTGAIVLIVLLFLTEPIQYTPKAVLAAIVFLIGLELVDVDGMRKVLAARPDEFVVAVARRDHRRVHRRDARGSSSPSVISVIAHMRRTLPPGDEVMRPMGGEMWSSLPVDPDDEEPARAWSSTASPAACTTRTPASSSTRCPPSRRSADPPRWICIDATAIPDVDYSGGETIRQLHGELESRGVTLAIAGAMGPVRTLARALRAHRPARRRAHVRRR